MSRSSQSTMKEVNTGQDDISNDSQNHCTDDIQLETKDSAENSPSNRYNLISEEGVLDLLVEIEYDNDPDIQDVKLKATTFFHIYILVMRWIENGMIEGVYARGERYLKEDLRDYLSWAYDPRIIHRKYKSIVECVFEVKTEKNAYQLYEDQ